MFLAYSLVIKIMLVNPSSKDKDNSSKDNSNNNNDNRITGVG